VRIRGWSWRLEQNEVGWIFVVGYEDLKKTAGHFSKWIKVTLVVMSGKAICHFVIG
jgi:hypothetical protein